MGRGSLKFKVHPDIGCRGSSSKSRLIVAGGLLVISSLWFVAGLVAQQPSGHASVFHTHQDYNGQKLNQRKTEFSGKDASPLAGSSRVLIKSADMKSYREDGTLAMAAQAAECIYDGGKKQANSDGPLQMHTGDGRFYIEGTGFLWNEVSSDLILSNHVHSILHSETTNGTPPTETVINSDHFSYEMKTGLAIYRDNVRVDDPKMKLDCEILTANLANPSAFSAGEILNLPSLGGKLKQPLAEDKVSQFLAARLSPETQKLLSDYAGGTNSQLQQAMTEDLNEVIQSGPIYDAERFAGVKLSPDTLSLIAKSPTGSDLVRLNRLLLQDAYPLELSRNLVSQAGVSSQTGGRPENIVAEKNVVIDFIENGQKTHATGDKAVYNRKITGGVTNEFMELTGNPKLARTNGWMTADVITMDRATDMIVGVGNYHSVFKKQPKTNEPPGDTEIFCDNFVYNTKTGVAVYRGHVRVNDPQMKLTGEILTASLPEKGSKPNHIVAETNVVIDFIQDGKVTHATGQRAVYDENIVGGKTNQIMELKGNPKLERTDGWMMADVILLDQGEGVIQGIGNHHSIIKKQQAKPGETNGPAMADTQIYSDGFSYKIKTRVALYLGNVRVNDPQMKLTSGVAVVWVPEKGGKPERIVAETNVVIDFFGSPLFTAGDIVDLRSLAAKLKQPSATDGVSQFVGGQLSAVTRNLLPSINGKGGTNEPLQRALVDDFNKLIQSGPIYDAKRFAGVKLQPAMTNLIGQAPQGLDLVWLNRRLLMDAYPQELSRNNQMESGEKTHATGDKAVYTYSVTGSKTNEVMVLTGNPMLGRPTGWTTGDMIVLDRTANMIRSVGHSYSRGYEVIKGKTNAPVASKQTGK